MDRQKNFNLLMSALEESAFLEQIRLMSEEPGYSVNVRFYCELHHKFILSLLESIKSLKEMIYEIKSPEITDEIRQDISEEEKNLLALTVDKTMEAMGLNPEEIDLHEDNPGIGSF